MGRVSPAKVVEDPVIKYFSKQEPNPVVITDCVVAVVEIDIPE